MKALLLLLTCSVIVCTAQTTDKPATGSSKTQTTEKSAAGSSKNDPWKSDSFKGLSFRSIGPSKTSGRVVDFAVNPANKKEYYVAAASGGVWKTSNSGISYQP